ncbi:hypothetical protein HELRODRAFT_169160 [Helobdella robusta]|uniref:Uncharacterized protein n=1 Tax=Helobdella robusta TaxID=6412 RepID=T1F1I1_HELRO|nr:hypothetical protein HELRODRAFT_169160 [Helobdella robusta]ESO08348.1 hypothetical protein HELRODRAFT_169160 [Helobdella robusta]
MDLDFLKEENWPRMDNTAVKQLEARDEKKFLKIERLKTDLESAKKHTQEDLDQKNPTKLVPLLVGLSDAAIRNPVLLATKKLIDFDKFKFVYVSPDLTEAERQLYYKLRQERNRLNAELGADLSFRYGIRGNQVQKFRKLC